MNTLTQTTTYRSPTRVRLHRAPASAACVQGDFDARARMRADSNSGNLDRIDDDTRGTASPRRGQVSLVGAGPGDPDLLTMRAVRRIAAADAVVYDNLVGDGILDLARPDAMRVYVGKRAGNHALPQEEINLLLIKLASQGMNVVRLKGGDPLIFGRGGEEMEDITQAGFSCEIVPGVTAASGMAAATGIPLTHRDHSQTVVFTTGHLRDGTVNLDWDALARPHQTVVIYMGLGALEIICKELIAHGLSPDTPGAVVHAATTPEQRIVTSPLHALSETTREAGLRTPSLIVIGDVVSLHQQARTRELLAACSA